LYLTAVTVALVCQAILTNDQNADADFNALMKDDERGRNFRKVLYTNKRLQDNLKRELPRFDRSGLLDVIDWMEAIIYYEYLIKNKNKFYFEVKTIWKAVHFYCKLVSNKIRNRTHNGSIVNVCIHKTILNVTF